MSDVLNTLGAIAGLGGLSLGLVLFVFRDFFAKDVLGIILPHLKRDDRYRILRLILILTTLVGVTGMILWSIPQIFRQADCSFDYQATKTADGVTTGSSSVVCGADNGRIKTTYLWLNVPSYTALVAGEPEPRLAKIVGTNPVLLKTVVFDEVERLLAAYGVDQIANWQTETLSAKQQLLNSNEGSDDLDVTGAVALRVLNGPGALPYPDVGALQAIFFSNVWPTGYHLYYARGELSESDAPASTTVGWCSKNQDVLYSVRLWKSLSRDDIVNYTKHNRLVFAEALKSRQATAALGQALAEDGEYLGSELEAWRDSIRNGLTTDVGEKLLVDITRNGTPSDFLKAFGWHSANEECDGSVAKFNFVIPLPTAYVQVAILETVGVRKGRSLPLEGIRVSQSTTVGLRSPKDDQQRTESTISAKYIEGLSAGTKIVIPVSIKWKYDWATTQRSLPKLAPDDETQNRVLASLARLNPDDKITWRPSPSLDSDHRPMSITKNVAELKHLRSPDLGGEWIYGPRLKLIAAILGPRRELPLREYDPAYSYLLAGYSAGSCPFVHVLTKETRSLRLGRTLIGAVGVNDRRTDIVELGRDVRAVALVEEEFETTHINRLRIVLTRSDGRSRTLHDVSGTHLEYGDGVYYDVNTKSPDEAVSLIIDGYYEPYEMKLGN